MNIPPKMLRVLRAIYNHPTFQIEFDAFQSGIYEQQASVRQGCPLGPIYSSLSYRVITSDIRSIKHGQLETVSFMETLYVDGTLLIVKNMCNEPVATCCRRRISVLRLMTQQINMHNYLICAGTDSVCHMKIIFHISGGLSHDM